MIHIRYQIKAQVNLDIVMLMTAMSPLKMPDKSLVFRSQKTYESSSKVVMYTKKI